MPLMAFAVSNQFSGPENLSLKSAVQSGVPVTAIKRMKIGAEANDSSRLMSLDNDRLTAAVAYVLACIPNKANLYVLFFLMGLLAIPMSVPAAALDSKQAVNGFYHTSWTAKDGLPGAVLSIAQTT